jgi:NAD(P)-dependent dehydrogenase (short-subunit alcohol dehydrogenase family)
MQKVSVITGGGSGMGLATARLMGKYLPLMISRQKLNLYIKRQITEELQQRKGKL